MTSSQSPADPPSRVCSQSLSTLTTAQMRMVSSFATVYTGSPGINSSDDTYIISNCAVGPVMTVKAVRVTSLPFASSLVVQAITHSSEIRRIGTPSLAAAATVMALSNFAQTEVGFGEKAVARAFGSDAAKRLKPVYERWLGDVLAAFRAKGNRFWP